MSISGSRSESVNRRFSKSGPHAAYKGFLFVVPILALFALFKFYPIVKAILVSLTDASPLSDEQNFVGLDNYVALTQDSQFLRALRVTAYYVSGTVAPLVVLSLGLALLLNQPIKGRAFFRAAIFIPALIPVIVAPILWRFLYHPFGLVNQVISFLGFDPVPWLTTRDAVIPAFIVTSVWRFVPLFAMIYLAGLQSIPQELYQAAEVDGASALQRFRHLTMPLLKPTTLVVMVIGVTLTAKSLVLAFVMTGGGPSGASKVLSLFIFEQGFRFQRLGYASATSIVLLLVIMAVTLASFWLMREQ